MSSFLKKSCVQSFLITAICLIYGCSALDLKTHKNEVWVQCGKASGGIGTKNDPLVLSGHNGLDKLFEQLKKKYGEDLKINFAPGIYYGIKDWKPASFWTIKGAGIDKTIFKTAPNPQATKTIGFRFGCYDGKTTNFVVTDLTFDFNIEKLRHANRAFLYKSCTWKPMIEYYYSGNLKEWEAGKNYFTVGMRRSCRNAVKYKGVEYIQIRNDKKRKAPENNSCWRVLHSVKSSLLPKWEESKTYKPNDAVTFNGQGFICASKNTKKNPSANKSWLPIKNWAPDSRILTFAVFGGARPPLVGNHRVERVKAINSNGSALHDKEDFVIGLGGNNALIKDCIIENFHGTYATLIVIMFGSGGKVINCKAYGNGECFAYGGWGIFDGLFENNYAENLNSGVNIDSLTNKNVTFRNNTFKKCKRTGLLINVSGGEYRDAYLNKLTMPYKGKNIPMKYMKMSDLTIENNKIEILDGAPFAALQLQAKGLISGIVRNNTLTKTLGERGACAVGLFRSSNIKVTGNKCDKGMYLKNEGENNTFENNYYPDGTAVATRKKGK